MNLTLIRNKYKESALLLANYLFILYAFLLPISGFWAEQIFIFILVLFLFYGDIKKKLFFALKNKVVQAFLLFYFMHLFWMIGSEHLDIALFKLSGYRFIFYILIYMSMIKEEFKERILSGFLMGIFFSELMSYSMHFDISIPFITLNSYVYKVPFMQAYTQYSVILSISLGIVLYNLFTKKLQPFIKTLYIVFFFSSTINIFIIASKLGYGLYFISIFIALFYVSKKYISIKIFILLLFIALVGYFVFYNVSKTFSNKVHTLSKSIEMTFNEKDYASSFGVRYGYNIYGIDIIKENLFFGVGTGDHINAMRETIVNESDKNKKALSHALNSGKNASLHSEYLDITIQFGVVGLLIFLNIFYQIARYKRENSFFTFLSTLLIIIYLFNNSVSLMFIHGMLGKIFIFLTVLTLYVYHGKQTLKELN